MLKTQRRRKIADDFEIMTNSPSHTFAKSVDTIEATAAADGESLRKQKGQGDVLCPIA